MKNSLNNRHNINRARRRFAYLLFIIATVIWGLAFIFQKQASVVAAFTVGSARSLLAAVFIFAMIPMTDKLTKNGRGLSAKKGMLDFNKRELIGGLVLGVIVTVATAFQQYGLQETDAGKAAFITALYVVIVPIMSTFLGKKPSLLSIISIPIAIVGFYFLCLKPGSSLELSDLLVLVCAVIFAVHIVAVDRFSPGCDGVRMSFIQFAVAFILNTLLALIFEGGIDVVGAIGVIPSLLFLGICSSGIAYTLQIVGQQEIDPTVSSMILSMEAVFGVIGGAIFLGERMSLREYIGCAIVFTAVILAQLDLNAIKDYIKRKNNEVNK